ncbi:MAG: glycosyltransferase family 4 protein [Planctomycetes bacterium]|nr:glycosyltransferase family 4 protein [Planctomycetota bacterium]
MASPGKDRIKLCYVCEATAGGVRKHLRELMRLFSRPEEGFEIHALLGDRGEPGLAAELEQLRAQGVRTAVLPALQRPIRLLRDRAAYAEIKRFIRELAPQLVHTHSSKAGFLGRLAAHAAGVPRIVHTAHVFPFQWATGLKGFFYTKLERYAARRCHAIVCVGASQREEALRIGLAPTEKVLLIPNGVEIPPPASLEEIAALRMRLQLPAKAPVVGMVARLAPQKGVRPFLEAAAQVVRARPDAIFVLAGGGPLEEEARARAAALGLTAGQFRFLGHVEDAERLYPAFDVLALSSLYEGLPYVLLEAMARGVPVVATDVQGSRDVIEHGVSGLLARPGNAADLAAKLSALLGDRSQREKLSGAALARVRERFSLEQFAAGHRKLYRGETAPI